MKFVPALLIVDLQNDFCPGGALAVPGGDQVVEPLNRLARLFANQGLPVLASRDWHPPITKHFKEYGGLWPPHCVQGSPGAAFHPGLQLPQGSVILSKGTDPAKDSYSSFEAMTDDGFSLQELLISLKVKQLYIGGLATDYCVRTTALDALKLGFEVTVISDAIAGVDLKPGDSELALEEISLAGAEFSLVEQIADESGLTTGR